MYEIRERLIAMEVKLDHIEYDVVEMKNILVGNGHIGLKANILLLKDDIEDMKKQETTKKEKEDKKNDRIWNAITGVVVALSIKIITDWFTK